MGGRLLTYEETRVKLRYGSIRTVYNKVSRGLIPVIRIPGLGPRVPEDELDKLIDKYTEQPREV